MNNEIQVTSSQEKKLSFKERRVVEKQKPLLYPQVQSTLLKFPMFMAIPIIYVVIGMTVKIWHPTWLMFIGIPLYYQLCHAFGARSMKSFLLRLPVIPGALLVFLFSGLFLGLWKYMWIIFLFIPVYYWCVAFMKK